MKIGRGIILASIVVGMFAIVGCGAPPTDDDPTPTVIQGTQEIKGPLKKSKFVVIVPIEDGKCTVHPFEREMGENAAPVEWVTFINLTDVEVSIQFEDLDAIGDTSPQPLSPDTSETFQIKNMTSGNKYDYTVGGCNYEPPPGGPRVVIP